MCDDAASQTYVHCAALKWFSDVISDVYRYRHKCADRLMPLSVFTVYVISDLDLVSDLAR